MSTAERVSVEVAERWATEAFASAGLDRDDAATLAASLAFAERRGVSSHGFIRTEIYLQRMRAGGINVRPRVSVTTDRGALVVLDADAGPGAVVGRRACDLVVERARECGVGCVLVRDASHFGAAGFFTNLIADAGMLGIVACNTDKVMSPPFGGKPVLGSNPFAAAVPMPADVRPQLDMATTETSYGKVLVAQRDHVSIPTGWAVGPDGTPTTSPDEALAGALLPAAGPKGFGLAFIIDALVTISGADCSPQVGAMYGDPSVRQRLGQVFLAIDVGSEELAPYSDRIRGLIDAVHGSGSSANPLPLVPGEPELNHERTAAVSDRLQDTLETELITLGERIGVRFPA